MSKASEHDLGTLHGVIARGLAEVISEGVTVGTSEDGEPIKATAPAAYFMAGITMLKNNNITADADKNDDLRALSEKLAAKRRTAKKNVNSMDDAVRAASEHLEAQLQGFMQ